VISDKEDGVLGQKEIGASDAMRTKPNAFDKNDRTKTILGKLLIVMVIVNVNVMFAFVLWELGLKLDHELLYKTSWQRPKQGLNLVPLFEGADELQRMKVADVRLHQLVGRVTGHAQLAVGYDAQIASVEVVCDALMPHEAEHIIKVGRIPAAIDMSAGEPSTRVIIVGVLIDIHFGVIVVGRVVRGTRAVIVIGGATMGTILCRVLGSVLGSVLATRIARLNGVLGNVVGRAARGSRTIAE
jgi:hypothetical protein